MELYFAQCFTSGLRVGKECRDIEAGSFLEAARVVCDEPLETSGQTERKRVRVWLQDTPGISMSFYAKAPKHQQPAPVLKPASAEDRLPFGVFLHPGTPVKNT